MTVTFFYLGVFKYTSNIVQRFLINPLSPHLRSLQRRPQAPHAKSKFLATARIVRRCTLSADLGRAPSLPSRISDGQSRNKTSGSAFGIASHLLAERQSAHAVTDQSNPDVVALYQVFTNLTCSPHTQFTIGIDLLSHAYEQTILLPDHRLPARSLGPCDFLCHRRAPPLILAHSRLR